WSTNEILGASTTLQPLTHQRVTYYRQKTGKQGTADVLQEMNRDCRRTTGDNQRLRMYYRR
ncbi:unnamed protein product, partial [Staurois parvus]